MNTNVSFAVALLVATTINVGFAVHQLHLGEDPTLFMAGAAFGFMAMLVNLVIALIASNAKK